MGGALAPSRLIFAEKAVPDQNRAGQRQRCTEEGRPEQHSADKEHQQKSGVHWFTRSTLRYLANSREDI
jgi:hypothetical protein